MNLKILGEIIKLKAFSISEDDAFKINNIKDIEKISHNKLFEGVFFNKNKLNFSLNSQNLECNENIFFDKNSYKKFNDRDAIILEEYDSYYDSILENSDGYICYFVEYFDFISNQNFWLTRKLSVLDFESKTTNLSYFTADILDEKIIYDIKFKGGILNLNKNGFLNSFDEIEKRKTIIVVLSDDGEFTLEKRVDINQP